MIEEALVAGIARVDFDHLAAICFLLMYDEKRQTRAGRSVTFNRFDDAASRGEARGLVRSEAEVMRRLLDGC